MTKRPRIRRRAFARALRRRRKTLRFGTFETPTVTITIHKMPPRTTNHANGGK